MIRLTKITGGCLKCKFLRLIESLIEHEVYCAKNYEYPQIKDKTKWVGHCDYLDYDEISCAEWDKRLAFCRTHVRERLMLT